MELNKLIKTNSTLNIESLMLDSRNQQPNSIFFCLKGLTVDGHRFIEQAVGNGAKVIVHSNDVEAIEGVEFYKVNDVMETLHHVATKFYNNPSESLYVYGITGTNGKSTTMLTVRNVLRRLGVPVGYIGTISVEYNEHKFSPSLTTPDIVELLEYLNAMRNEGIKEVCLEVSSQGLSLHRVDSIQFNNASFTNLTHDHLDYHKTMESYFEAKKALFDMLDEDAFTVINADDEYGQRLLELNYPHTVSYGIKDVSATYRAQNIVLEPDHTKFDLVYNDVIYPVETNYVAIFNVYNTLNAIAILHERGYDFDSIIPHLKNIDHVEGRQTFVDEGQDFKVLVDFGHAPDSMKNIFEFVRETLPKNGRIISVFGAAGGRDTAKRPIMGKIATENCDHVIITEHDNRDESVESITKDIISGITKDNYEFIPIRTEAIRKAIKMAKENDVVVLIGKGEERFIYREHGSKEPWMGDDECARMILREEGENYETK